MMKVLVAMCALVCIASAASIKWTGLQNNNQWTSPVNWYPAQVPGPNDDVTIETGNVLVTISTGVNSLTMGTNVDGVANLTIFESFAVGTSMDVDVNGNLILNAGTASLQGTVTVKGHLYLQSGTIGGQITIASNGIADLSGGATKNLIGCGLTNQGSMMLAGVVGFNQSSVLSNQGSITAVGATQLVAGDTTATLFDASSGSMTVNAGSGNSVRVAVTANFGTVTFMSGDMSSLAQVMVGKDLRIPAGSTFKTEVDANTTFGGSIHGSGNIILGGKLTTLNVVNVSSIAITVGYATFNGAITANTLSVGAGTTNFNANGQVGSFTIVSGNINFMGTINADTVSVQGGVLTGSGGFSASKSASFASQGINLGTTFTLTAGTMAFNAKTLIAFAKGGSIVIASGVTVTVSSPLTVTGPPGSGSFKNDGSITVSSSLASSNIDLLGSGSYSVSGTITTNSCNFSTGVITLNGGTVSGLTTALNIGSVTDANTSGDVEVQVGSYSFQCPHQCKSITSKASGDTYTFSAN